jgi:putative hydrolase of the HAD superfamily
VIKLSFAEQGVAVSTPMCLDLYSHFSKADAYILHKDVLPCLNRLAKAQISLGIISDFDERLEGILLGLGLTSYFSVIIQSFVEGYSKPSQELWHAAVARIGDVGESWHIGDDPEKDAFIDSTTIILDRKNSVDTKFRKISSLVDLPELLDIP